MSLKPYMGYDNKGGSEEGAVLIFAHNAKEAKRVAWAADTFLPDACDGEYINLRVTYLKDSDYLSDQADQDKLSNDIPHVIESPETCRGCNLWGPELDEHGYCESCAEEYEPGPSVKGEGD